MVLYIHKRKGDRQMKLYSVVYETEYVVDYIDFDSVEEVIFFFATHGKEIQHYSIFKYDQIHGYRVIADAKI
jgi:hypothetical protein